MPFCEACGNYTPVLYPGGYCKYCYRNLQIDSNYSNKIHSRNNLITNKIKIHLLAYTQELFPHLFLNRNQDPVIIRFFQELNGPGPAPEGVITAGINTTTNPSVNQGGNISNNPHRALPQRYFKYSNTALLLLIISLFLVPQISILLDIFALILGFIAKRSEPSSWRVPVIFVLSIFFILLNIIILFLGDAFFDLMATGTPT